MIALNNRAAPTQPGTALIVFYLDTTLIGSPLKKACTLSRMIPTKRWRVSKTFPPHMRCNDNII